MKVTYLCNILLRPLLVGLLLIVLTLGCGTQVFAGDHAGGHDSSSHSSGKGHSGGKKGKHGDHSDGEHSGKKGHEKGHGGAAKSVAGQVLETEKGKGSRPVWAKEGLPDVELGRLNVSRAPDHVLNKALAEAHKTMAGNPQAEIHSPLQNLALYYEAVTVEGKWTRQDAARFLGAATEKRVPISNETVEALNIILGVEVSDPAGLAADADRVRQEILKSHDSAGESGH